MARVWNDIPDLQNATSLRGLDRNSNPRVPLQNMHSILSQVLLVLVGFSWFHYIGSKNFTGARKSTSKFCGCQAPVAPVLSRPLLSIFHKQQLTSHGI